MAKDPAVLFYTSDFLSGTFTMSNEQVGKYIRLLCLQHQKGKLTENDMLSICKAYDEDVYSKFRNEGGFFFNERMFNESKRRQEYSESRRKNAQAIKNQKENKKAYAKHMETETETINVLNTNTNTVKTLPVENWDSVKTNFFNAYEWQEKFCRDKNLSMVSLKKKLVEFISDIELKEEYKPLKELKSHFTNLFNKKSSGDKTSGHKKEQQSSSAPPLSRL
jgi:hypothetical protein